MPGIITRKCCCGACPPCESGCIPPIEQPCCLRADVSGLVGCDATCEPTAYFGYITVNSSPTLLPHTLDWNTALPLAGWISSTLRDEYVGDQYTDSGCTAHWNKITSVEHRLSKINTILGPNYYRYEIRAELVGTNGVSTFHGLLFRADFEFDPCTDTLPDDFTLENELPELGCLVDGFMVLATGGEVRLRHLPCVCRCYVAFVSFARCDPAGWSDPVAVASYVFFDPPDGPEASGWHANFEWSDPSLPAPDILVAWNFVPTDTVQSCCASVNCALVSPPATPSPPTFPRPICNDDATVENKCSCLIYWKSVPDCEGGVWETPTIDHIDYFENVPWPPPRPPTGGTWQLDDDDPCIAWLLTARVFTCSEAPDCTAVDPPPPPPNAGGTTIEAECCPLECPTECDECPATKTMTISGFPAGNCVTYNAAWTITATEDCSVWASDVVNIGGIDHQVGMLCSSGTWTPFFVSGPGVWFGASTLPNTTGCPTDGSYNIVGGGGGGSSCVGQTATAVVS